MEYIVERLETFLMFFIAIFSWSIVRDMSI
jgi:hypothetical protein